MKNPSALILMSTYQGEKYLSAQLDSIRRQTFSDWVLLIRDDGSRDETVSVIKKYMAMDERILFCEDTAGNLKPCMSFAYLLGIFLKEWNAPFGFFADQDDVWVENKLELAITQLQNMDSLKPALVFSDLTVVNEKLNVIHESFLEFEHYQPQQKNPLNTLLVHNYVTGCTVGFNRKLAELAFPIPESAIMHDWWCALIAGALGNIQFINEKTILYRQHGGNSIGSRGHMAKLKKALFSLDTLKKHYQDSKKILHQRMLQAKDLSQRMDVFNNNRRIVDEFASLLDRNIFSRLLLRIKLKPTGVVRKIYFLFLVCFA